MVAAQSIPPSYGHTFLTIGAPGNRPANQQEAPRLFPPYSTVARHVGAVNYEYRITQTEVTVGQWFQFVQAYKPYYTGSPNAAAFASDWISWNGSNYVMTPSAVNYPANMSWRMAARYTNWLHNGRASNQAAFENGVYDTSTFTQNANGSYNDQSTHSPGATFWIASEDEWVKAMHYDPNRYGPGEEGYWQQPGGREAPFVSGLPGQGGETNGGLNFGKVGFGPHLNVSAYPDSQSPWGLLGASGGRWEFTETWGPGEMHIDRIRHGSQWFLFGHDDWDRLDQYGSSLPTSSAAGFRIVSIVPSPGGAGVFLVAVALLSRRRRP